MNKTTPESRKLERQVLKWHNEKFDKLTGLKVVKGKLKMFTPEAKETIKLKPEITYKMKKVINSIKKAVLHLNILSLLFLFACGSDNPVDNGSNPPVSNDSLVFSVVNLQAIGSIAIDTTVSIHNTNDDSLKMSFTLSTNCIQANNPSFTVNAIDTSGNYFLVATYNELNSLNKSYTLNFAPTPLDYSVRIRMKMESPQPDKYIKLTDFKVFKAR